MAILPATLDLSSAEVLQVLRVRAGFCGALPVSTLDHYERPRRAPPYFMRMGVGFITRLIREPRPTCRRVVTYVNLFWTDLLLTPVIYWGTAGTGSSVAVFCHSDYLSDNDLRQKVLCCMSLLCIMGSLAGTQDARVHVG